MRVRLVAAATETSLELRINKVEDMLVELKALDVSEDLVKSIKDELKALKITNLEDKVAAAKRQQIGLVVPTAPHKWADKQSAPLMDTSSALEDALRAFDYGQRAATEPELQQLRAAIERARAAGVPESDLAIAKQLEHQAAEKAATADQVEAAEVAEARQAAYMAIDEALRGIDYGQRAATEPELQQLSEAIESARGAGVPESDLVMAQQLRRQAARRAVATEEMLQAAADGVKTRRREAAEREAEAAKAQEAAKAHLVAARAAAEAAERAAAERAAVESEGTQLELKAAIQEIRDSVRLPGPRRKKVLRDLQVKWHPDRQYGDARSKELALEVTQKINEAMAVAKANAKQRGEAF